MKIVNYDAPEHLAKKVLHFRIPEFIHEVVRPLEDNYYNSFSSPQLVDGAHHHYSGTSFPLSPIWKFEVCDYENIAILLHTIPIYLRNSRPEAVREVRDENRISIIDLLGAYYSNRKGDSPYIELYLTAIEDSTQNNDKHFKWLFAKVLIHELAHASLDIFNEEHSHYTSEKVFYHTEFGRWREESMANAVALRIIKEYGNKEFYDFAKAYMFSQPAEYALGVLMEDFRYWDFRSVYDAKKQGVNSVLQQGWLNYVQNTPDWAGLQNWNDLLNHEYVYSFKERYYTSEKELVYDIVNVVLSDYENNNGTKMPFTVFSSIFPCLENQGGMSYEPAEKVKDDSGYKNKVVLNDGVYYLSYFWNNKLLHDFIANVKVGVTELKNY